jgi:hypothetical protein
MRALTLVLGQHFPSEAWQMMAGSRRHQSLLPLAIEETYPSLAAGRYDGRSRE